MNQIRTSLFLTLLFWVQGCCLLQPTTTELKDIHDSYRLEFAQTLMPENVTPNDPDRLFSKTLELIGSFRQKHTSDTQLLAHLTVLEGMIYLQSGQIGRAQAVASNVSQAAGSLRSANGKHTRDELFALSFDPLLRGWTELSRPRASNWPVRRAGDDLHELLNRLEPERIGPDYDEGALYLAASAVTFWMPYLARTDPDESKAMALNGYNLLGRYLSAAEKQAARIQPIQAAPNRLRYLELYHAMWVEAGRP